jgi:MYXO-CTERM domain-containing protein
MSPKPPKKRDNPRESALDQTLHWGPDMTRKSALLLWLTAWMIGWGPGASAQTAGTTGSLTAGSASSAPGGDGGNITVSLVKAGKEDLPETMRRGRPIGLQACIDGTIEVTLSNLPNSAAIPFLEVWYATGLGMCNQGDRGSRNNDSQECTRLYNSREGQRINSYPYFNAEVDIKPVCRLNSEQTSGVEGAQTLWFMLLRSENSAENADFYNAFTLTFDTTAPAAPEITTAGTGQTDIRLGWELPPGEMIKTFWVAADYSGGLLTSDSDAGVMDAGAVAANGCSSNYLIPGQRFDPNSKPAGLYVNETGSISTSWSFTAADFMGAKKVPAVVVAQDLAGNLSLQSKIACLTVTQTTGFWDRYKSPDGDGPGIAEPGCACSAPGTRSSTPGSMVAAVLALLFVGASARRRIRRRAR